MVVAGIVAATTDEGGAAILGLKEHNWEAGRAHHSVDHRLRPGGPLQQPWSWRWRSTAGCAAVSRLAELAILPSVEALEVATCSRRWGRDSRS